MTPPELQDSVLSLEGRVALLTMNRHDVRNELTGTRLAAEVAQVAEWVNRNERVSVLVLTGEGTAFSAGGNVKHMRDREHGSFGGDVHAVQAKYRQGIQRMALAMFALEVPSIDRRSSGDAGSKRPVLSRRRPLDWPTPVTGRILREA